MIVITDRRQIAGIAAVHLRQLINQRIQETEESCPWNANELGPMIVIEPGDTASELETVMGFSRRPPVFSSNGL